MKFKNLIKKNLKIWGLTRVNEIWTILKEVKDEQEGKTWIRYYEMNQTKYKKFKISRVKPKSE